MILSPAKKTPSAGSVHFSSDRTDWATPRKFAQAMAMRYSLNLDVCASSHNAVCNDYFDVAMDGLSQSWAGRRCWMNPPYGRAIGAWVRKAAQREAQIVVALLPARTDTAWWHDHVAKATEIQFHRGRITFEGAKHPAPFPSAIAIWGS